jgi:plasmid stabilization system protein ParE
VELRNALREVFSDHLVNHRMFAICLYFKSPSAADSYAKALFANAKALAQAIASLYGEAAGRQFESLFSGHIGAAAAYADAAFKGDEAAKRKAAEALLNNADQIADFLAKANPNIPRDAAVSLLREHARQLMASVDALAKGDVKGEVSIWDTAVKNVLTIADALADAIVKQFPEKFR